MPNASVGSETPTIVASCGRAMRPAVSPPTNAVTASSRGRTRAAITTVTIAEEPDHGVDERRGAQGDPDDRSPADPPRLGGRSIGVPVGPGVAPLRSERLGGNREAEAQQRDDDDRPARIGQACE